MRQIITLIFLLAIVTISAAVFGQPFDPPGGPGGDPITDPAGVPIDGGLGLLIVAGIAYGGKKLHQRHKEEQKEND